jgi:tRNA nucleotidyltransferase (CCA-adding enzyme)
MEKIFREVLKQIVPSQEELKTEQKIARELKQKIRKTEGKHVSVQLLGSMARNTHLKGDRDLDLFVFFPKNLSRKEFEKEGLRIGKKVLKGHFWEEAYSEHPYIRGNYKGFEVEIIPTYKIRGTHEKQSSVDRTPFHHQYLEKKLSKKQKNEVRLLKRFLKGIQAYGADTHYNSLPGYATELLIVKYKTFANTIRKITEWKIPLVIDIEEYWKSEQARQKFSEASLILIDPTDSNRNVGAALSSEQMKRIIRASRAFLKKPESGFFFPEKTREMEPEKIRQLFRKKNLFAITAHYPEKTVSDIVWGQIKKTEKKIRSFLEQHEFALKKIEGFTDEKKQVAWIMELAEKELPKTRFRLGPPMEDQKNVERFLKAHPHAKKRVQNGRIGLEIPRTITNAKQGIQLFLKQIPANQQHLPESTRKTGKALDSSNVQAEARRNKAFRKFAAEFLEKKKKF